MIARRGSALFEFAKALGGEFRADSILCPGPGHSALDRSLSVKFRPDGDFTCFSFADDPWDICRDHVRVLCGLPQFEGRHEREVARGFRDRQNRAIEEASRRQRAAALWVEATDPRESLVERYLNHRGLDLPDDVANRVIRYHPHCAFRDEHGERLFLPAMIARYSPIAHDYEPEADAVHRTALRGDASGHLGKRMLGSVAGRCVKICVDEDVALGLHIAEGIETALACRQRGFRPIWAATTAGCISTFPVLGGIECLTIFADHDATGLSAAQACAERWSDAGREVFVRWPKGLGRDCADQVRP